MVPLLTLENLQTRKGKERNSNHKQYEMKVSTTQWLLSKRSHLSFVHRRHKYKRHAQKGKSVPYRKKNCATRADVLIGIG